MHSTKLVTITPNAEMVMGYCARVSNPANQGNDPSRLLGYCIKHGHWSVFELAHMVLEIKTTRAVSAQILRHRSFAFQEFSQRYATVEWMPEPPEQRLAGATNRQSSIPVDPCGWNPEQMDAICLAEKALSETWRAYQRLVDVGIANETARNILPLCTPTTMYMAGSVRSWIHYIGLRTMDDTQAEHRAVALSCRDVFTHTLPIVSKALGWDDGNG